MFSFVLDVLSTVVGAVLPIYKTWKVIRSRKTTLLVPLAKYWSVFGVITIVESIANMLCLSYFIPGYSIAKFIGILYIYTSGYQQIFDNIISPFLKDNEPTAAKCLMHVTQMGGRMITQVFAQAVNYTICTVAANNVTNLIGPQSINGPGSITEHFMEVQEDDEVFYSSQDVKPLIDCVMINDHQNVDSDSDQVEVIKQTRRKGSRRRLVRKKTGGDYGDN